MTIKEEIQIEEYKRTFAEAYKQGFKDGAEAVKEMPQTFISDGITFAKMDEPQTEREGER